MPPQVSKEMFEQALWEMGHDPMEYKGKRISIQSMSELYEIDQNAILEAIDLNHIDAHYDYNRDTIWVDALDAAHFYYCVKNEAPLYSSNDRVAA